MLVGCAFEGAGGGEANPDGIDRVIASGAVVDFVTGEPVTGVSLESVDLTGGEIATDDSSFTISEILPHSVFRLRVSAAGYATTITELISVETADVDGLTVEVIASQLIGDAYAEAQIARSGGIMAGRLFDTGTGDPVGGVAAEAFTDGEAAVFLGADQQIVDDAPATTSTGVALVLNVTPGLIDLESGVGVHSFIPPTTRVEDGVVSIVDVEVGADPPPIPTDVYLDPDVMDVFTARGCLGCHSGGGPGQTQGGFGLNGDLETRHDAVLMRVDLDAPEQSLLLRKPSFEDPPDSHQIIFANRYDPDYLIMLGWIIDGAPEDD
jgi:hypothetical protein